MRYAKLIDGVVVTFRDGGANQECVTLLPDYAGLGWREPLAGSQEWRAPLVDRQVLLARLAERRWQEEVTGCDIQLSDGREFRVASDRESRSVLNQFLKICELVPDTSEEWKTLDGSYESINEAFAQEIALQLALYVRECFARERIMRGIIAATDDEGLSGLVDSVEQFWEEPEV